MFMFQMESSSSSSWTHGTWIINRYEVFEQSYSHGGAFKPLSVWGTEGFDVNAIEEKSLPHDIRPDRMFGQVYRVPLLTIIESGSRGMRSSTTGEVRKRKATVDAEVPKGLAAIQEGAEEVPEPEEGAAEIAAESTDGKRGRSAKRSKRSSSSSSSNSSSSTSNSTSSSVRKKRSSKYKKQRKAKKQAKKEKKKRRPRKNEPPKRRRILRQPRKRPQRKQRRP